jgi:uncharacterized protein (DUF433 family)
MMNWHERITADPKVLVGKPVIKGTRISVELIVDLLAKGWTTQQILDSYPNLTDEDIRACLAYASELLHAEKVFPLEPA